MIFKDLIHFYYMYMAILVHPRVWTSDPGTMNFTILVGALRDIITIYLKSVPRHLCCIFGRFLTKYTPVKEVQLKSMKGKISKIFSFTRHFSIGKFLRNEKQISYGNLIGNVDISFHSEVTRNTLNNILKLSSSSAAKLSPVDITFLSHVLKSDKLKGAFLQRNIGNF